MEDGFATTRSQSRPTTAVLLLTELAGLELIRQQTLEEVQSAKGTSKTKCGPLLAF